MAITTIVNNQASLEFNDNGTVFFLSKMNIGTVTPQGDFVYIQNVGFGDVVIDWRLVTSPVVASASELADTISSYLTIASAGTGWASYVDTQYTIANKLVVAQGAIAPLPNNSGTIINSYLPAGVTAFYDSATTKITPSNIGDCYVLRVAFSAETNNNSGVFELDLDIGGTVGRIFTRTFSFPRGTAVPRDFTFAELVYSLDTFKANGGQLEVASITGTTQIWNVLYNISRVHSA